MQTYQPSLIARSDTLLGVCAAIGEDFGFNPTWLRIVFALTVFLNLFLAIGIYCAAGVVVLLTRLLYRSPRKLLVAVPPAVAVEGAPTAAAWPEADCISAAA